MKYFNVILIILFTTVTGLLLSPAFADNVANIKLTDNKTRLTLEDSKAVNSAYANPSRAVFTEMNATHFAELSKTEQETVASIWGLNAAEYAHYLTLMEYSVDSLYYRNQPLDPVWILGMNAKTDEEQRKYVTLAVLHERERVRKLLRFQQAFDRI